MYYFKPLLLLIISATIFFGGCVSTQKYQKLQKENEKLRAASNSERATYEDEKSSLSEEIKQLKLEKEKLQESKNLGDEQIQELLSENAQKTQALITKDSLLDEVEKAEILAEIKSAAPAKVKLKNPEVESQVTIGTNPLMEVVQDLIGDGVEILPGSVTSNLKPEARAYGLFEDSTRSFGISRGLLMTSGSIDNAKGPNVAGNKSHAINSLGDESLNKFFSKNRTYDACTIEFDIIPYADTLAFNFVFASEEYEEWVGSRFDDVFAFFISGKGINGQKNMAVVPGTKDYVSINTINNGQTSRSFSPQNAYYYLNNNLNDNPNLGYDGYTRVLKIRQPVVAKEKYHLKLTIADVSDRIYDSGLFIEGKSIISYFNEYMVNFASASADLDASALKMLDDLIKEVKSRPGTKLQIDGHTDFEGEEDANLILANRRSNSVAKYLKSKGLDKSTFHLNGWGEKMPIADNENEEGKAINRRVEIRVLGTK